jgi:hypothetical protein
LSSLSILSLLWYLLARQRELAHYVGRSKARLLWGLSPCVY